MEQDETLVKKSSIINRIKMENWTSSSKIELLVQRSVAGVAPKTRKKRSLPARNPRV